MPFSILPLHLLSLAFVVVTIFLADREAFAWIRGRKITLDAVRVGKLHRRMWLGLLFMIATGLLMAWENFGALFAFPLFRLKMFFVAALIINGLFIGKLMYVTAVRSYSSLSTQEKIPLFLAGAISAISWLGAAGSALLLFGL